MRVSGLPAGSPFWVHPFSACFVFTYRTLSGKICRKGLISSCVGEVITQTIDSDGVRSFDRIQKGGVFVHYESQNFECHGAYSVASLALGTVPAFAQSPVTVRPSIFNSPSHTKTTIMTIKNGVPLISLPNTTSYGDCGTAALTMFNGGSKSKIDAHWAITSYVGVITWENVSGRLSNGMIEGYDGPGPLIQTTSSGQVTFSGLKSKTTYYGTLTGTINVDNPLDPFVTECELKPTSTDATTL